MAQQIINVGTNPNDGTGDTLRGAFVKTDDNFTDLYTNKQNTLISGTNIKTINSTSLLGSGNVSVQPTLVSSTNIKTINGNSILGSGDLTISGGITGSGTDNYIPRFNGTTALENSIIFDNGTNVGIGTSSPVTKLDLGSSTGQKLSIYASGNDRAGFGIETSTLRYYTPTNTIHSFGHLSNSDGVTFSERMRIDSSGKVGIGTSSPSETLHVNGNLKIADGSTTKLHITDTILNGIIEYNGFMIDNTTTQFGIDVGTGAMIGVKASTDAVFINSASEYFGLAGGNESKLVASNALMQGSPADGTTITNWIKVEDENGTKFYLPLYQ
jgi:hypothetical protein